MQRTLEFSRFAGLLALALFGLSLAPQGVVAQSELDSTEAEPFMGDWDVALETQMGPFNLDLLIEDQDGKVAANIGSPDLGGAQEVTDITRDGENLLLAYEMDAQGQVVPVAVTLTPAGEDLTTSVDFGGGMFVATGTATPADG